MNAVTARNADLKGWLVGGPLFGVAEGPYCTLDLESRIDITHRYQGLCWLLMQKGNASMRGGVRWR